MNEPALDLADLDRVLVMRPLPLLVAHAGRLSDQGYQRRLAWAAPPRPSERPHSGHGALAEPSTPSVHCRYPDLIPDQRECVLLTPMRNLISPRSWLHPDPLGPPHLPRRICLCRTFADKLDAHEKPQQPSCGYCSRRIAQSFAMGSPPPCWQRFSSTFSCAGIKPNWKHTRNYCRRVCQSCDDPSGGLTNGQGPMVRQSPA